jgi:hypothetical protein
MSDEEWEELENKTIKIFAKHCYNLKRQCALLEVQIGKTKQMCHIKTQLKILCSRFFNFDTCTYFDVCISRLNRLVLHMEKLEMKLAKLKGGQKELELLKRKKIESFLFHINLSIKDVIYMEEQNPNVAYFDYEPMLKQLLKLKRKMFLIFQMKKNWEMLYLKQIKRYKKRASTISCFTQRYKDQMYFKKVNNRL